MNDTVQLKKKIRREILDLRDHISAEERLRQEELIKQTVFGMSQYREADVILAYVGYRSEVSTSALLCNAFAAGKKVFVPKVFGNEMEFFKIGTLKDLQPGYMGILEPPETLSFPEWLTVMEEQTSQTREFLKPVKVMMWMPGAVFDQKRCRIGYGGGFYDRYLERLERLQASSCSSNSDSTISTGFELVTAALAYPCQVLEELPQESHDRKPDHVIAGNIIW